MFYIFYIDKGIKYSSKFKVNILSFGRVQIIALFDANSQFKYLNQYKEDRIRELKISSLKLVKAKVR